MDGGGCVLRRSSEPYYIYVIRHTLCGRPRMIPGTQGVLGTGVLECSLAVSLAEIFKLPLWVLVPGSIPAPSMQNLRDVPIHTAKTLHQI